MGRAPSCHRLSQLRSLLRQRSITWTWRDQKNAKRSPGQRPSSTLHPQRVSSALRRSRVGRMTGIACGADRCRASAPYRGQLPAAARPGPRLADVPVVQCWTVADYLRCVDLYAARRRRPGPFAARRCRLSVPTPGHRRAHTILTALHGVGVKRLHGLGIKVLGLRRHAHLLTSADFMAGSGARAGTDAEMPDTTSSSATPTASGRVSRIRPKGTWPREEVTLIVRLIRA